MTLCARCGEDERSHHDFVAPPKGCVCEPKEWPAGIGLVCARFSPAGYDATVCAQCEHDLACHPVKP